MSGGGANEWPENNKIAIRDAFHKRLSGAVCKPPYNASGGNSLLEEETAIKATAKKIFTYKRTRAECEKKQRVRMPLLEHLRREVEVIEQEDLDENWVLIGEEVIEQVAHKPRGAPCPKDHTVQNML